MELEWYAPLTILPAVGLIILSTSNFLVALNNEIYQLEKDGDINEWIINQKLKQLKRLGIAMTLLYSSALFFMFSALLKSAYNADVMFDCLMVIAVVFVTTALGLLFFHSVKAIKIRHTHLELKKHVEKENKEKQSKRNTLLSK